MRCVWLIEKSFTLFLFDLRDQQLVFPLLLDVITRAQLLRRKSRQFRPEAS
jgi:hypothetical protein